MSSSHWVSIAQPNNSQIFGGCTSFSILKSVCRSQNTKCVCQSQNRECVCQSQNSHIESPSEGGGPRRTDNGMQWYELVDGGMDVSK